MCVGSQKVVVFYQFGTALEKLHRLQVWVCFFWCLFFNPSSTAFPCPSTANLDGCRAIGKHEHKVEAGHSNLSGHLYKPALSLVLATIFKSVCAVRVTSSAKACVHVVSSPKRIQLNVITPPYHPASSTHIQLKYINIQC